MDSAHTIHRYNQFLSSRGIRRIPRNQIINQEQEQEQDQDQDHEQDQDHNQQQEHTHPLISTIRSRATSDGNIRINTIISNLRQHNTTDTDNIAIIEDDEPLRIISIIRSNSQESNNSIYDDHDQQEQDQRQDDGQPQDNMQDIHEDDEGDAESDDEIGYIYDGASNNGDGFRSNENILDSDVFYTIRRESFAFGEQSIISNIEAPQYNHGYLEEVDKGFEYKTVTGDSEVYSSGNVVIEEDDEEQENDIQPKSTILPKTAQEAYEQWEFKPVYPNDDNGTGIKPLPLSANTIDNSDPSKILMVSPGEKFPNSLVISYLGVQTSYGLEDMRKYKNNLSTIISHNYNDYLVLASNSELLVYEFDRITDLPNKHLVLKFDTRPNYTSNIDRLMSTWPYFPHTINFIKTLDNFNGQQCLGVCSDDGTLLMWYTHSITDYVRKFQYAKKFDDLEQVDDSNYRDANRFSGLKIHPDFKIKLEASLWGLDEKHYQDQYGSDHYIMVCSDNSQSLSLFYYHTRDERFYHVKSHQVLHNIPEVSIVDVEFLDDDVHSINVACASISGELIVFNFKFKICQGPLDKDEFEYFRKKELLYYVDSSMEQLENRNGIDPNDASLRLIRSKRFKRCKFSQPRVISRNVLSEDGWTIKPINGKYFLPVSSIGAVFGDLEMNESEIINKIDHESKILDLANDPLISSHLGVASQWQFFESKTTNLAPLEDHRLDFEDAKLTSIDDEYRRIHKDLLRTLQSTKNIPKQKSMNGKLYRFAHDLPPPTVLLVSTGKKLGMFKYPSLYCNCATKRIFNLSVPFNEESKFLNRISITHIIPELSCFIAVSQLGLVSIMRLCKYRGIYGMRQEHLFPNALSLSLGYHGYRTITGLSVRNRSVGGSASPRYYIYISYNDGIIIGYELKLPGNDDNNLPVESI